MQCLKNSSKVCILAQMGRTRSLQFWFVLGPNFLPENFAKKKKKPAKTASLGISNNVNPRSQKNPSILVKLSKPFFWT